MSEGSEQLARPSGRRGAPAPAGPRTRRALLASCLVITALVVAVFGQVVGFAFLFDDDIYVSDNLRVQEGLTLSGVRWAFTTTRAEFWHPLVWLSFMLDRQLFGPSPGGFHFTALVLHLANALLFFLIARRMTGRAGAALFAALLFALHPLRAESVAWVSDRKDLLSAFFFLATLRVYVSFVSRPAAPRYLATLACYAGALMSKPSVVSLPLLLLVLDWWPLNRLPLAALRTSAARARLLRLALEKVPFLVLSLTGALAGFWAEASRGGVAGLALKYRVANGLLSIVRYLRDLLLPVKLGAFYPHAGTRTSIGAAAIALLFTASFTLLLARLRRQPHLLAGWLWYLLMVLPVLGLIQVGNHSHADRYTYLPHLGIVLALAVAAARPVAGERRRAAVAVPLAAALVALLSVLTFRQTAFWRDGFALYPHTIAVTERNTFARLNLGYLLWKRGDFVAAEEQFREILRINPRHVGAMWRLALALDSTGRREEALLYARQAALLKPQNAEVLHNLGYVLAASGHVEEAIEVWRKTIALDPEYVEAYVNLGLALAGQGAYAAARESLAAALRINPRHQRAQAVLAALPPAGP